jgi:hypothetical protein
VVRKIEKDRRTNQQQHPIPEATPTKGGPIALKKGKKTSAVESHFIANPQKLF